MHGTRRRRELTVTEATHWVAQPQCPTETVPMRVLIADDHRLILEGIRSALAESPGIEIVGEAHVGTDVLPLVTQLQPDVLLLDLRLPQMDGITVLELVRARAPEVKVVILSILSE